MEYAGSIFPTKKGAGFILLGKPDAPRPGLVSDFERLIEGFFQDQYNRILSLPPLDRLYQTGSALSLFIEPPLPHGLLIVKTLEPPTVLGWQWEDASHTFVDAPCALERITGYLRLHTGRKIPPYKQSFIARDHFVEYVQCELRQLTEIN